MAALIKLADLDERAAAKLASAGAGSVESLLRLSASPASRRELARLTGLDKERLLGWARQADLMRVKGVGGQYAELLGAIGVSTVVELARSSPSTVREAVIEANASRPAPLRAVPALHTFRRWIATAMSLSTDIEE